MAELTKSCAARWCWERIPLTSFMCHHHWALVPLSVRLGYEVKIRAAYRYFVEQAIDAVERIEAERQYAGKL